MYEGEHTEGACARGACITWLLHRAGASRRGVRGAAASGRAESSAGAAADGGSAARGPRGLRRPARSPLGPLALHLERACRRRARRPAARRPDERRAAVILRPPRGGVGRTLEDAQRNFLGQSGQRRRRQAASFLIWKAASFRPSSCDGCRSRCTFTCRCLCRCHIRDLPC